MTIILANRTAGYPSPPSFTVLGSTGSPRTVSSVSAHPERVEGCSEFHDRTCHDRSNVMSAAFVLYFCLVLGWIGFLSSPVIGQEKRAKVRISNAGFTITALPLLAAKDWGVFNANGLDVEVISTMSPVLDPRRSLRR